MQIEEKEPIRVLITGAHSYIGTSFEKWVSENCPRIQTDTLDLKKTDWEDSKGPVFFKQKRVGIYKSHFFILKFRTMRIDTPKDTPTHLLSNPKQYITKMGGFLRKTSLDELPQIINILK